MISDINRAFGQTPVASEHGELLDHMLGLLHWFMLILFIGWSCFLIYCFYKFRSDKNPKAHYSGAGHSASHQIEIGVIIVEAILLLGFAFPLWSRQADSYPTGPDVVKMRAMGEKFLWNFQYAGDDKNLGIWDARLVDPTANPLGRDMSDPNAKDDFVNPGTMKLPLGRPVIVDVASKDVIHNLALVPMRSAQDATPGVKAHMWFTPTKTGTWDIICGQLCGPGHAQMKAQLEVISADEWDAWAKEMSKGAADSVAKQEAKPVTAEAKAQ
ncbi:MAG: cytochrome c oxidase subunit II [Verrucomicrobiales bacterium]|nr:cytochrome c oxidase subunit II [Verrucomicrobiales bacterium]